MSLILFIAFAMAAVSGCLIGAGIANLHIIKKLGADLTRDQVVVINEKTKYHIKYYFFFQFALVVIGIFGNLFAFVLIEEFL